MKEAPWSREASREPAPKQTLWRRPTEEDIEVEEDVPDAEQAYEQDDQYEFKPQEERKETPGAGSKAVKKGTSSKVANAALL